MARIVVLAALAMAVVAYVGCSSSNSCESLASALCSYASYTQDTQQEIADSRKAFCTCWSDGPDKLDTDYQKMACRAQLAQASQLNPDVESDAKQLESCAVTKAVLDDYKDTYIKTCVQSGGGDACRKDLTACDDACMGTGDGGTGTSADDTTGCLNACALTYPCDSMCR